jgi:hypothetical protein
MLAISDLVHALHVQLDASTVEDPHARMSILTPQVSAVQGAKYYGEQRSSLPSTLCRGKAWQYHLMSLRPLDRSAPGRRQDTLQGGRPQVTPPCLSAFELPGHIPICMHGVHHLGFTLTCPGLHRHFPPNFYYDEGVSLLKVLFLFQLEFQTATQQVL